MRFTSTPLVFPIYKVCAYEMELSHIMFNIALAFMNISERRFEQSSVKNFFHKKPKWPNSTYILSRPFSLFLPKKISAPKKMIPVIKNKKLFSTK